MNTLITILSFAFVLGVLVFVHELGHFLAAKRVGIRVLKFQLGFNPTILSVKRGDTEYGLGALPLGGYVKMAGDNPDEARTGAPDEFLSKTKWERFQVLIMGPSMNLLLAVVVTAFVLYRGADVPLYEDQPPVVGVVTEGSPAAKADVQPGDRILTVADRNVDTWEQFFLAVAPHANQEVSLAIQRDGRELERKVTPIVPAGRSRFEAGDIGVEPDSRPLPAVGHGGRSRRAERSAGRRPHPRRRRRADDVSQEVSRNHRLASRTPDGRHGPASRCRAGADRYSRPPRRNRMAGRPAGG